VYLGTASSPAKYIGTRAEIGCALSDGSIHMATFCMTNIVNRKTLVLGLTTRNARADSLSTIHPKLAGRRQARVTYRTHDHHRAARKTLKTLPEQLDRRIECI
jgi:hypothetical protein